jgi:Golgi nucleoside diphosphatase
MRLVVVLLLVFVCVRAQLDYGIIIDAGSSGSRIYLYEWPERLDKTLPLVEQASINQTVVSTKTSISLESFATNPTSVSTSLSPLITYVQKYLPKNKWSTTPIYLKATAGMRALPVSSQTPIIAAVQTYLATTGFEFQPSYAKVIPGTDEGAFGWITTNYALQLLTIANPNTVGALDMGGASTQITFNPASTPTNYEYTLNLGQNTFDLYTYSYPIGQDQALRVLLAGLVNDSVIDANGNIANPCYLVGYNETYLTGPTLVVGTGDLDDCSMYVEKYLVISSGDCTNCGVGNVYQPPITGDFYAFSGFAYTFNFFGLGNSTTIADLHEMTAIYCSTPMQTVIEDNPSMAVSFLKVYCFTGVYQEELLLKYGFTEDANTLSVTTQVGNIELTYALGAMIYEAGLLPITPTTTTSTTTSAGTSSVFLSTVLYLICACSLLW